MPNKYKKYLVMILFVLLSLGITNGVVFAYSEQITLDAKDDAGWYPGQDAFLTIIDTSNNPHTITASNLPNPNWTSQVDVYASASALGYSVARVDSAGNIWSTGSPPNYQPDLTVGESLTSLHEGIYRITPISGAYQRDSFGWSPYSGEWWWELHIRVHQEILNGVFTDTDYTLGSQDPQNKASDALSAFSIRYIDIPVKEGGSLNFWIWDWDKDNGYGNSIDNSGSLTFNVASVPEPSTILLLSIGIVFLIRRSLN